MALVMISVLTLMIAESSARSVREYRIIKVRSASDQAYFAAEAGFSRIRSQMSLNDDGQPSPAYRDATNCATPKETTEDFTAVVDGITQTFGHYTLTVWCTGASQFRIVSKGWGSAGDTQRYVSGTITVLGLKTKRLSPTLYVNRLAVNYDP